MTTSARSKKPIRESVTTINQDGSTKWTQANEFRCEGLMMRLMMRLMPGAFRKETMKQMESFKAFAEKG